MNTKVIRYTRMIEAYSLYNKLSNFSHLNQKGQKIIFKIILQLEYNK